MQPYHLADLPGDHVAQPLQRRAHLGGVIVAVVVPGLNAAQAVRLYSRARTPALPIGAQFLDAQRPAGRLQGGLRPRRRCLWEPTLWAIGGWVRTSDHSSGSLHLPRRASVGQIVAESWIACAGWLRQDLASIAGILVTLNAME